MRFLIILILFFSTSISFAGNKDFSSDRWGKMAYDKGKPYKETHSYTVGGKKKKMKYLVHDEIYFELKYACNILGSRTFVENKTKKLLLEHFYVNTCTPCLTKEELEAGFTMCPYPELEVLHAYEQGTSTQFIPTFFEDAKPNSEGLVYSSLNISSGPNETFQFYKIQDSSENYIGALKTYKTPFKQQMIKMKETDYIDDPEIQTLIDSIMNRVEKVIEEKFNVLLTTKEINTFKSKVEFFPELNIQRRD